MPDKVTCTLCGAQVRHLLLHLKRLHGISDRRAMKKLKEAAIISVLVSSNTYCLMSAAFESASSWLVARMNVPFSSPDDLYIYLYICRLKQRKRKLFLSL